MFNFRFPQEISVTFQVHELQIDVISLSEIREVMGNIASLLNAPVHEEGKDFTIQSSTLDRLYGFAKGMIALYDVFYEIIGENETVKKPPARLIPKVQLALVVQMHTNALQPRNIFIHFLNQIIDTLGFHIFFEIIEKGAIIFVQDRESFSFIARAINPSFVNAILDNEHLLRGPNPRPLALELLNQLGISLKTDTKS